MSRYGQTPGFQEGLLESLLLHVVPLLSQRFLNLRILVLAPGMNIFSPEDAEAILIIPTDEE
jgi:hypothetical protein